VDSSLKQLPSPEDFLKKQYECESLKEVEEMISDSLDGAEVTTLLSEYAKEVVKYTLEQAANKATAYDHYENNDVFQFDEPRVNKKSITSLEEQIIKDLNL
jgi:flavoprotein